ncbi:Protein similar to cobyrinic acid a,c-diamide synthetase clustered with dissimilatory sulfite reductase [hydrothermal vent metagenome]|uniref:Protein similar to cobyrinic acid a,c-diamide synthetase clustered with dissimilatory sulfite reductase n=1 Tax=hydrothermal vent metagenome TaxID=652676 RepID=A0A3B0VLJ6_9ZZZZ
MSYGVKSLVVAGLSGGSGKSVVAVGLVAALRGPARQVVPFKKGPDYIDAGWLTTAAGRPCYNLDPYLMSPEAIADSFQRHCAGADFAVIEGNRGLYDGVNVEGGFSTAELAIQLDLPVLLVVNCSKTTRTVAAMVLGCRELDHRLQIGGVILNQIATPRHESIIRQSVERITAIPVMGIVPRMRKDIFPMRRLGVTPPQEYGTAGAAVSELAEIAGKYFDLEAIDNLMRPVASVQTAAAARQALACEEPVTIGVLRDRAFQFYYEENLEALRGAGARLVMIDALSAPALPAGLDGLYIGGGFPETSARQLADNIGFRDSVRQEAEKGLPIYAECGGLIFLGRAIVIDGTEYPLAGVFPVTFGISRKPQAHGYSIFSADQANPFYPQHTRVRGHEFRYSTVLEWDGKPDDLVLNIERGTGFMGGRDGLVKNNVMALYTHVLATGTKEWAPGLIRAATRYQGQRPRGDEG